MFREGIWQVSLFSFTSITWIFHPLQISVYLWHQQWQPRKVHVTLMQLLCFDDTWKRRREVGPEWCQLRAAAGALPGLTGRSCVRLFATPWITAHQASLSITNSRSLLKPMCIESVMPSSHLILCRPLLLLPPIPPSIRVFSNESALRMRWPKYWSFSFSISPSNEHPGLISFRMD